MRLKKIDINGFKSFGRQAAVVFDTPITGVVGPNGSGKSNVVESIRFALGEQSIKSMRGGQSTDFLFKSGSTGRGVSRAAVSLTFDNSDRVFRLASLGDGTVGLDTDDVVIAREVYSDGSQKYSINGAAARMRDIVELISSVNIGSSGHHIISQGESDRFLFSSPKERRILLEEALGLKMYHYRINETERKLEKSRIALREARILHKELEPHVRFLRKQIEKINQAETLRNDIKSAYNSVLSPLGSVIVTWTSAVNTARADTDRMIGELQGKKSLLLSELESARTMTPKQTDSELSLRLQQLREEERLIMRDSSKHEIAVEHIRRDITKLEQSMKKALEVREVHQVPLPQVRSVMNSLRELIDSDTLSIAEFVGQVRMVITSFEDTLVSKPDTELVDQIRKDIETALRELGESEAIIQGRELDLARMSSQIAEIERHIRELHQSEMESRAREFDVERQIAQVSSEIQTLSSRTQILERELAEMRILQSQYESDMSECAGLFGVDWRPGVYDGAPANKSEVDALLQLINQNRRQLDRLKIRLEDLGVVSVDDVVREHSETEKRYSELGAQIVDIEHAIAELEPLLIQLQSEIRSNFREGVERINAQFGEFFVTMFGGGHAEIVVVDTPKRRKKDSDELEAGETAEDEQGVDIKVKIPNKKQGDLSILSGGERSLTSIALLFSLSQVNPPPFIVLDETDAALDEANSRRYGQLMKKLSDISQILVVTHNRETMGHCQRLYGVTLGADSASQLFSVKFEEAVKYAK
jgi:chromosome segregation ATPase